MNEIVNYHNDFSSLSLRNFTAIELDILMTLCNKCKDKGTEEISISFDELKRLTHYKQNDNVYFVNEIEKTNKKLLHLDFEIKTENETIQFVLFPTFITSKEKQTLTVSVNKVFEYILNDLSSNFTKFELQEFVQLKSSYSKSCYRQLKRYRDTGYWNVTLEDFRLLLDIPKSYKVQSINERVLKPIMEELPSYFHNLTLEKKYGKGRGKPVIGYEFYFDSERIEEKQIERKKVNETGFICNICGQPLIEKVINGNNCWCHADGWKDNAKCKKIYNSVSEIMGYESRKRSE